MAIRKLTNTPKSSGPLEPIGVKNPAFCTADLPACAADLTNPSRIINEMPTNRKYIGAKRAWLARALHHSCAYFGRPGTANPAMPKGDATISNTNATNLPRRSEMAERNTYIVTQRNTINIRLNTRFIVFAPNLFRKSAVAIVS